MSAHLRAGMAAERPFALELLRGSGSWRSAARGRGLINYAAPLIAPVFAPLFAVIAPVFAPFLALFAPFLAALHPRSLRRAL
jgi:hypothetical protein